MRRLDESSRTVDPACECATCSMDPIDWLPLVMARLFGSRLRALSRHQVTAIANALRDGIGGCVMWSIPMSAEDPVEIRYLPPEVSLVITDARTRAS